MKAVLGASGLIAVWPAGCARQTTKPEALTVTKPGGVLVNDIHTELNPTLVDRIVYPNSLETIQEAIHTANHEGKVICITGTRHSMGSQQFASNGVLVDMTTLSRVLNFNPEEGTIEVESGIQWPKLIDHLITAQKGQPKQWGIAQKQNINLLSIGGSLCSNIHGRGLQMKPFVQDIESFVLIDANGNEHRCSRQENTELFRLAVGGYGLFGIVYSLKLRLVQRQKIERVVEIINVEDLMSAYEERIADGFLYGDFLYNANTESDDFLRKGIFICYRPVDTEKPVPDYPEEPSYDEWINQRYLAHADKQQFFEKVAHYYLSTSGKLYWSDTHQMNMYVKGYHDQLDRMLNSPESSDITTEVYVSREELTEFIGEVREYLRKNPVNNVFGDIGVLEQDDESFLSYARQRYTGVGFNVHTVHSPEGIEHTRQAYRRLIDMAIQHGGSYYLTHHKFATPEQVKTCYPQFAEFLRLKKQYDPEEQFQSDWYRYYKGITV
ncbi:MAG TPA: FAD-binding oxidoreductase [Thermodesulfobacteriota bacterium]|nr:FAD-binding oxidoreductase [Thermodesulfobacteriota bacterium]